MFQLFLRARTHQLLKGRPKTVPFRVRSAERDDETDKARIGAILSSIEDALAAAEREQAGLSARVDEALARASVTFGNGTDEYLVRDAVDDEHQRLLATYMMNGQRRLESLASTISHLRFLKAALLTRFPEHIRDAEAPRPS